MPTTMNPATTQTVDYQAIITATIAKLEEIIAEHGDATEEVLAQPIAAQPTKRVSQEDDGIITSEEYHDVYDTQRDNSTDVTLCEQFEIYVFFIREICAKIEQDSEITLGVAFDIVSDSFGQLRLTLFVVNGFVIIDIDRSTAEYDSHEIYRMGFDETGVFIFDNLNFYRLVGTVDSLELNYSGFIERERFILFNIKDKGYDFKVISDVDDEIIAVSVTYDAGEGIEAPNKTSFIRWHDAETDRRTSITFADDTVVREYYEFFNEHGIWLMYMVPGLENNDTIDVWWSLLDATGWDYVYDDPSNDNETPYVELYKNDERIFLDDSVIVRGDLSQFTCLYLVMSEPISFFTADVLNLSEFGLSFNYTEITPEALELIRMQDTLAAPGKAFYQGVDLLGDDVESEIMAFIPTDLLAWINDEN
jgi:hypothetical protein